METNVERLADDRVILKISVPADDVDLAVKAAYKRMATELKVPGFRKGHVPAQVIDNYMGRERVLADVQETIIQSTYAKALDKEGLRPIDSPDMGEMDLPEEGQEFHYEAEVAVRPELGLSSWEGIRVTAIPAEVTEDEVQASIDMIRGRFATLEPVEDRGIEDEDFALISFKGLIEGEEFEGSSLDHFLYEMGKGPMPEEFDSALLGKRPGEHAEACFPVPENSSLTDSIGKLASFTIEVHEIKRRILPPLDEDFANNAGFESLEEALEAIRTRLSEQRTAERSRLIEEDARRELAGNLDGEVPKKMIEARAHDMLTDFLRSLEAQNISPQEYITSMGLTIEGLEAQYESAAAESIAGELALEALFRALELEIADEEVEEALREIVDDGQDLDEVRERFERAGIMKALREQLAQRKANAWLLEHIEITEGEVAEPAEVAKLVEDAQEGKSEGE